MPKYPNERRRLEYLKGIATMTKRLGYPPNFRQLMEHLGLHSTNAIAEMLDKLEAGGYCRRNEMTARSILLTPKGQAAIQ